MKNHQKVSAEILISLEQLSPLIEEFVWMIVGEAHVMCQLSDTTDEKTKFVAWTDAMQLCSLGSSVGVAVLGLQRSIRQAQRQLSQSRPQHPPDPKISPSDE